MIAASVLVSSFKQEVLLGIHDFMNDEFWIALYTSDANLGSSTVAYVPDGEVAGTGYAAGGQLLTSPQVLLDPGARTAFATFADPVWADSAITARGALIYNQSKQQRAVVVLNFGGDQTSNMGDFHVIFPPPTVSAALLRIL